MEIKRDSVSSGERKRTSLNLVSASLGALLTGSRGTTRSGPQSWNGVIKRFASGTVWNGRPEKVTALYAKAKRLRSGTRVPQDTWNPAGIREDHLPRLSTTRRPIVNKYREGKVKSTPARGVK